MSRDRYYRDRRTRDRRPVVYETSGVDSALRAVIMLVILGGAGWAAAKYTPIVEIAARRWDEWQHPQPSAPGDDGGDAPAFQPDASAPTMPPQDLSHDALAVAPIGSLPATMGEGPKPDAAQDGRFPGRQVDYERDVQTTWHPASAAREQYADLDARLAQFGSVYTLMERWGRDRPRFRFLCKVALAGNSAQTRPFEAFGDDPLQAMRRVVDEVAAWRDGRLP